jgi:hypothetical protein
MAAAVWGAADGCRLAYTVHNAGGAGTPLVMIQGLCVCPSASACTHAPLGARALMVCVAALPVCVGCVSLCWA